MIGFIFNLLASIEQYVWTPEFITDWIVDGCERYSRHEDPFF